MILLVLNISFLSLEFMQPFLACQVECRYMSTVKILSPVSSYGIYKSIYQVQNGGHGVDREVGHVFMCL